MARQELSCFLRDRRADLRPADVGLPAGPRPSPRILDALAAALRLAPAERTHLFRLAGTSPAPPSRPGSRGSPVRG